DEGGRSTAGRRRADHAVDVRWRSRDEGRAHAVSQGGDREGLSDPGRYRHVVRADPRVPRILRFRDHDRGRTPRRGKAQVLSIAADAPRQGFWRDGLKTSHGTRDDGRPSKLL